LAQAQASDNAAPTVLSFRGGQAQMASFRLLCLLGLVGSGLAVKLQNSTSNFLLRGSSNGTSSTRTPCSCQANDPAWRSTTRTVPKCVFIDLGAANGNSFQAFMSNQYGPVSNCPSGGQWEAVLVEANPEFTPALQSVAARFPGMIHPLAGTAAYMCQGQTSFSIDPDVAHNRWGSSMVRHFDGSAVVTVPTLNVVQLVAENTIPGDYVILKVDIEGAEYDVIPCLAQYSNVRLIDAIYLEEHGYLAGSSAYTPQVYAASKSALLNAGINMPAYNSPTL